ncbi:MAG TPA: MIP/aquaporin family protein [Rhabdaerophilum sp.]|nr:MIP/aquaporin family protein [Rhabdaerophilum sp.]
MNETPLPRALAAEALGTAFLVATVVGSGITAERLAGDNQALALLCNTIPTGAILVVLITILGPVSGAHFNPAVSLVFAALRQMGAGRLAGYIVAQCAGGMAGALLANAMFGLPLLEWSTKIRTGGGLWLSEAVAVVMLLGAIFGGLAHAPRAVPMLVGLTITATYWFTASTSFANPAVTFGRMFSDSFAGIAPSSAPAFILAQIAGALLGLAIWRWLFWQERATAP